MAYKIFRQGEPPSQRDLQMLMDQSVIVCTSTSRPFVPHEGMLIYELDSNGFRWYNGTDWVALGSAIDAWIDGNNLSVPGNLSANGTFNATGDATAASLTATNDVTMRGSIVSRLVDGRVGGDGTETTIGNSDTTIISANLLNVPQVADRVYMAHLQLDFNPTGTVGESRMELKIWNGSVGGTQLGGTVRWMTGAPIAAAINRICSCKFVWRATSTTTISNLNLSAAKSHNQSNGWQAEVNAAFVFMVEELGSYGAVTGL